MKKVRTPLLAAWLAKQTALPAQKRIKCVHAQLLKWYVAFLIYMITFMSSILQNSLTLHWALSRTAIWPRSMNAWETGTLSLSFSIYIADFWSHDMTVELPSWWPLNCTVLHKFWIIVPYANLSFPIVKTASFASKKMVSPNWENKTELWSHPLETALHVSHFQKWAVWTSFSKTLD